MKNVRFEFFIAGFVVVITIIAIGIYLLFDLASNKSKFTMILSPLSVFECTKEECKQVETISRKVLNVNYSVYSKDNYYADKKIVYNDATHALEVYDNGVKLTDSTKNLYMLLVDNEIIDYKSFRRENMTTEEINSVNKSGNTIIDYALKSNLDYDNDGVFEDIYYLKSHNRDRNSYYSVLAYKDGSNIEKISENSSDGEFAIMDYMLTHVIDMNKDGQYELVTIQMGYDGQEYCNQLYKLSAIGYEPMNECKIVNY